jgi:hypothetical protein
VAAIIGAVLLFSMLFSVGTGYFLFVNNVNTFYVKGLSDRATAMQTQFSEILQFATAANGNNHLTLTVTNNGANDANLTGVLVIDPNKVLHTYGIGFSSNTSPTLPLAVGQGGSVGIDTGILVVTGTYTLKVLTQRGNAFLATYPPTAVSLADQALASGAIGDLYIRFHSFTWYNVVACTGIHLCLQKQGSGFGIPASSTSSPIAFSIQVTNLNSLQQNITLDQYTLMTEFIPPTPGTGGGTARSFAWFIVSNSSLLLAPFSPITLLYNTPVTLVFASDSAGTLTPYSPDFSAGTITYGFIVTHGCLAIRQSNCLTSNVNYGQVAPYISSLYY